LRKIPPIIALIPPIRNVYFDARFTESRAFTSLQQQSRVPALLARFEFSLAED